MIQSAIPDARDNQCIPQARALALKSEFSSHNLTPLLTCASLVSRTVINDYRGGFASDKELPVVWGRLFVGQVNGLREQRLLA